MRIFALLLLAASFPPADAFAGGLGEHAVALKEKTKAGFHKGSRPL